jgi:hypothetical protein
VNRDIAPRADEATVAAGTEDAAEPCPELTEQLIPWLRERFPEISPRTSHREVVDACIARKGINDLIDYLVLSLQKARDDQKED